MGSTCGKYNCAEKQPQPHEEGTLIYLCLFVLLGVGLLDVFFLFLGVQVAGKIHKRTSAVWKQLL